MVLVNPLFVSIISPGNKLRGNTNKINPIKIKLSAKRKIDFLIFEFIVSKISLILASQSYDD